MKISHNNHSYLSPSKLNGLTTLPVSVKTLHSPPNTDNNSTYTAADLDELIVSNSNTLSKYHDDERNDNNLSLLSSTTNNTTTTSKYTRYSALIDNKFNKTITTDDSFNYFECNGLSGTNDISPSFDSNHLKLIDTTLTTKLSSPSVAIDSRDYSLIISDLSPLNRIQNLDDLLLTQQAATASTSTTSATSSWTGGTNNDYARNDVAHETSSSHTRRPFLSTQNRFLSLSISPPLSRRQTMPVLRGTFVSL